MKLFAWLLVSLGFVASKKDFTFGINKERAKFGLDPIIRNKTIEQQIYKYNDDNGLDAKWYYTNGDIYRKYNPATGNFLRWQGDFLMNYMNLTGWSFLWRDRSFRTLKYIHSFRLRQRDCFDLSKCSTEFYNSSISCLIPQKYSLTKPYMKCSWAYHYYPKMIERHFTDIACIRLRKPPNNHAPGFHKENKPKSYFCYSKINQTNDYPLD